MVRTQKLGIALVLTLAASPLAAQSAYRGNVGHDLAATAALTRLAAGAVPDDIETLEAQLRLQSGTGSYLRAITGLGFRMRGTGPALTATSTDLGIQLLVAQAARDSEAVRTAIFAIDEARGRLAPRNLPPPVDLAEAELSLGDSSAALARLRAFRARATVMERTVSWGAVQNGWLLGRTWMLLGDLAKARGSAAEADSAYTLASAEGIGATARAATPNGGRVRLAPSIEDSRVRYDAVLWMQPVVALSSGPAQPTARLTFSVSEHRRPEADGTVTTTQTFDSIALDVPLLDRLGAEGLRVRRAIQASAGSLTAVTRTDSLDHITIRTLSASALPDELKRLIENGAGFGPLSVSVALPGRAVVVGDHWTSSVQLDVPGTADPVAVTATYRLARIQDAGGRRLAFITIDAGSDAATGMSDGGRAQVHLTGELVRDCTTGETLRLAASLRATTWSPTGVQIPVRVLLTALREAGASLPVLAMR